VLVNSCEFAASFAFTSRFPFVSTFASTLALSFLGSDGWRSDFWEFLVQLSQNNNQREGGNLSGTRPQELRTCGSKMEIQVPNSRKSTQVLLAPVVCLNICAKAAFNGSLSLSLDAESLSSFKPNASKSISLREPKVPSSGSASPVAGKKFLNTCAKVDSASDCAEAISFEARD